MPSQLHPYWTFREELTVEDGLILKGTRIIIPSKKCESILKHIYEGHLGINASSMPKKQYIGWD